jgi:hypothetical protein
MTARIAAVLAVGLCGGITWGSVVVAAEQPPASSGIVASLADFGTAGRESCRRAIDSLPLQRIAPAHHDVIAHYRRSTTLHRRLPTETIHCDPDLLAFLLAKPEALVDIWRVLGISRVSLDPVARGQWQLSDGYGTVGMVRLLHHERSDSGGLLILHGQGGYSGPLSPKDLTGSCLLVIRHQDQLGANGKPAQQVVMEAFLEVDGLGLELVARTLQPLIVRSAAANLHEICLFVSQFSAAANRNPAGIARLADRMNRTSAPDRQTLVTVACGQTRPITRHAAHGEAAAELHEELASRWMPVDSLDSLRK